MAVSGGRTIWEAETFGESTIDVTIGELLDRQGGRIPIGRRSSTTTRRWGFSCG